MINPPEMPFNDEAYIASRCATVLAQKTKRETSDASQNEIGQLLGQF